MADEIVALYDEQGRECGSAPRSRMRAENLRHAATCIVLRDTAGRIFLHRRTMTKDMFPGLCDFAAGGVLAAGEDPYSGAVRELAEELGIVGAELEVIGEADYADERSRYHAFRYTAVSDDPVTLQPEEVAWGEWVSVAELRNRIRSDPADFVPDTLVLWEDWLAALG